MADRVTAIMKAHDIAATIAFYSALGFEVNGTSPQHGEATWCEVERDGVAIQFVAGDTPWDGEPAFTGTLYVVPPSVHELYEHVKAHVTPAWGPEEREWGALELGFRDPNGYFITFTERT